MKTVRTEKVTKITIGSNQLNGFSTCSNEIVQSHRFLISLSQENRQNGRTYSSDGDDGG
jgi:hypothetical protein